jgi:Protein of unknown function (DUF3302)
MNPPRRSARLAVRGVAQARLLLPLLLASGPASASMFAGEALDKVADVMAIIVIIIVPLIAITLFWLVHILPEKIAHSRQHPQTDAVKVLCLLSLVFGGLLWPLAWILAYTKPVLYKMAYGTDKLESHEQPAPPEPAVGQDTDIVALRRQLEAVADTGASPDQLREMRDRLLTIEARLAAPGAGSGVR